MAAPNATTQKTIPDVPFSPPAISEDDIEAVVKVLRSGWITTGPVSKQFEQELSELTGTNAVLLQSSCTTALETILRLAGGGVGDEVLVPAYTYTASASAVLHTGASVVLVDNALGSFVPSVEQFVRAVTPKTKAIVTVDFAGIPFPSDLLRGALVEAGPEFRENAIASLGRPLVIADAAHSLGAERDGTMAGTLADLTAFSFHAVKNLTTAEGGALTWRSGLVEDEAKLYQDMYVHSLHGQTKDAREKSKPGLWEYDIVAAAYKANMPDVLAALGLSQLQRYGATVRSRTEAIARYRSLLAPTVEVLEHETQGSHSSGHLAVASIPVTDSGARNRVIEMMAERGVATNVHYKPLPLLTAYRNLGFRMEDFPNAYRAFSSEVTLPLFNGITPAQVERVAEALTESLAELGRSETSATGAEDVVRS